MAPDALRRDTIDLIVEEVETISVTTEVFDVLALREDSEIPDLPMLVPRYPPCLRFHW